MTSYLAVFHPPANPDCRTLWTRLDVTRETSFVRSRYPVAAIAASSARSFPGRSLTFASYRDIQVSRTMPHVIRPLLLVLRQRIGREIA